MTQNNKLDFIDQIINERKSNNRYRTLKTTTPVSEVEVMISGKSMINFSSNDYLGLSKHPLLKQRSKDWIEQYGNGSTGSRLICGTFDCIDRLEKKLARLKLTESSLILNTGFQTNISIIPALADNNTLILSDELNHNSIIQGCILARCDKVAYRHNDIEHLKELLLNNQQKDYSRIIIISETVFSMDGDRCDLQALQQLSNQFNAILILDEAHATGVLGEKGMGLACKGSADIIIGTFGKACGSFGAYVACSAKIRNYLINYCTGFVFTTALPPAVLGAIDGALDLIPQLHVERQELHKKAEFLRQSLSKLGFDTGNSSTQIVPVILGDEVATIKAAQMLEASGILATAIRPPTVPLGQSRIRIALSSSHSWDQVKKLIILFEELRHENSTA
ncbi:MAG: 8-amino-7-oxononanoate synthase [Gammaproteobacteria bacterium]|nr:MAG: 8-amino-7-oxononanoate synthase [Gammaproteobacteria bacterium]